jgi:hypothetical protein
MPRQTYFLVGAFGAVKESTARQKCDRLRINVIFCIQPLRHHHTWREIGMAKGTQKSNREAKKPKKEKIKTIAAAPSQKTGGGQPALGSGKKK